LLPAQEKLVHRCDPGGKYGGQLWTLSRLIIN
jgi:hypothetical protein